MDETFITQTAGEWTLRFQGGVNPLRGDEPADVRAGCAPAVWSGWSVNGGPFDEPRDDDEAMWLPGRRQALMEWVVRTAPACSAAGVKLLLRPNARHVLGDAQSAFSFVRQCESRSVGLLLEPAGLLAHSMLARADEHLSRMFRAASELPGVEAVVLSNIERAAGADRLGEPVYRPCALEAGVVDAGLIERMCGEYWSGPVYRLSR